MKRGIRIWLVAVGGFLCFAELYGRNEGSNDPTVGDVVDPDHVLPAVIEFADAAVFFECNATDVDLGMQLFFDAEGWETVQISGPVGKLASHSVQISGPVGKLASHSEAAVQLFWCKTLNRTSRDWHVCFALLSLSVG